jgi:hypothetical protein
MIIRELIEYLKTLPPDLPVFVRYQDPLAEHDYWLLDTEDISLGDVRDCETEKESPAVLIGDDRV